MSTSPTPPAQLVPEQLRGQRVVVHCGLPKTGTSAIQQAAWHGREALGRAGVLYPSSVVSPRDPRHQWFVAGIRAGKVAGLRAEFDRIVAELSDHPTVMLSAEGVAYNWPRMDGVARSLLVELSQTVDLELVIVVRKRPDFLLSMWGQAVINPQTEPEFGRTWDIETFAEHEHVAAVLDTASLVAEMERSLPEAKITVLPYDGEIVDRVFAEVGVSDVSLAVPEQANRSLSPTALEIVRRTNGALPPAQRPSFLAMVRELDSRSSATARERPRDLQRIANAAAPSDPGLERQLERRLGVEAGWLSGCPAPPRRRSRRVELAAVHDARGMDPREPALLFSTARALGGALADAPCTLHHVGELPEELTALLDDLEVERVPVEPWHESVPHLNKLHMFRSIPGVDVVLGVDTDIAVLGDPTAWCTSDAVAAKPVDREGLSAEDIGALFGLFDVAVPRGRHLTSFHGAPTFDHFNSGVVSVPSAMADGLQEAWSSAAIRITEHLEELTVGLRRERFHIDQWAFAVALAQLDIPVRALPLAMNFPTNHPVASLFDPDGVRPVLLHHHHMICEDGRLEIPHHVRAREAVMELNRLLTGADAPVDAAVG